MQAAGLSPRELSWAKSLALSMRQVKSWVALLHFLIRVILCISLVMDVEEGGGRKAHTQSI